MLNSDTAMRLTMKDIIKLQVVSQLVEHQITIKVAARRLNLSERQVKRIKKRYLEGGRSNIIHKSRNTRSRKAYNDDLKEQIVRLYRTEYFGWNFSHFKEKLDSNHSISVSYTFVRDLLNKNGIESPRKYRAKRKTHPPRERRENAGELLQVDASDYDWLGIGHPFHLHGAIDDATGIVTGVHFEEEETIHGYLEILRQTIEHYGIPECLYTDYRTVFQSNKQLDIDDILDGKELPPTRFSAMLERLGVGIISTMNPCAKGRIERLWNTFQDRLSKELRQAKIKTIEEANQFIQTTFLPDYNSRFASTIDYNKCRFVKVPSSFDYNKELALRSARRVHNGCYIRYNNQSYTLFRKNESIRLSARTPVDIYEFLDHSLHVYYKDTWYDLKPVAIVKAAKIQPRKKTKEEISAIKSMAAKTNINSPWRKRDSFILNPKKQALTR